MQVRWTYELKPRTEVEPADPPTSRESVAEWLRFLAAVGLQPGPAIICNRSAAHVRQLLDLGTIDNAAAVALDDGRVLLTSPAAVADVFTAAAGALEQSAVEFSWRDLTSQRPTHDEIVAWRTEQARFGSHGPYLWPDRSWALAPQLQLDPAPLGPWYAAPTVEIESFEVVGRQLRYSSVGLSAGAAWAGEVLDRLQRLAVTANAARTRAATLADVCAAGGPAMGSTRPEQKAVIYQRGTTRGDYDAALDLIVIATQELWLGLRQVEQVVTATVPTARPATRSLGVFSK
jgi:hypothetical protein